MQQAQLYMTVKDLKLIEELAAQDGVNEVWKRDSTAIKDTLYFIRSPVAHVNRPLYRLLLIFEDGRSFTAYVIEIRRWTVLTSQATKLPYRLPFATGYLKITSIVSYGIGVI